MSAPSPVRPEIVVSLPGRTPEALKGELARAQSAGADIVEIRLDRMDPAAIPDLSRLHEIPLRHEWVPLIATLRSTAEGGEGPVEPSERRRRLEVALDTVPFSYLDLELARDACLVSELTTSFGRKLGAVHSAHFPPGTSTALVFEALHQAEDAAQIAKVVLPASVRRVVQEIIPRLRQDRWPGRPYVLHTTGPAGALLRVLAPRLGMAWVFCSLPEGDETPEGVEPSQVPVDRYRRFRDAGPGAPWYAVVGRPLGHTLSPTLQGAYLEATGAPGIYVPLELEDGAELLECLPSLVDLGLSGLNVTRPYKETALELPGPMDEEALLAGACNTLLPTGKDHRHFRRANTDVVALRRLFSDLEEKGRWTGERLLVVGTGGAARAAVAAGVEGGARVQVTGRRPQALADLVGDFPPEVVTACPPEALTPSPLVVHATPVGQQPGLTLDIPLDRALSPESFLLDVVYRPVVPQVAEVAQQAGCRYEDGWRMFVWQAAASFEIFTGHAPPEELIARQLAEVGP